MMVYILLVLITWNHMTMYELLVLDKNTWNHINVCKQLV